MVLLRVGLAILKMKERQILACPDFESCWILLKKITKTVFDGDMLMKVFALLLAPSVLMCSTRLRLANWDRLKN